jgi:hypothetical protein
MNGARTLDNPPAHLQRQFLTVGLAALAVWVLGAAVALFNPGLLRIVLGAYLVGYLYVLGLSLGCLVMLMIHHLTGGLWGAAIRRVLEAGTRVLPVLALLFIPVLLGARVLYLWTRPEAVAADELLQHKSLYLNTPFFLIRTAVYFLVWLLMAALLNRWASEQERMPTQAVSRKLRLVSGPGLVVYGLTITFASVDWVMSLEPHWFSTIYGMIFMVGQGAAGLAFAIGATLLVSRRRNLPAENAQKTLADLGGLMLAFVMLWAYIALSQFLITWAGNLPEEIPWYLIRMRGGWGFIALVLVLFHFFVPFVLLLQARVKRSPRMLFAMAALIMVMGGLDLVWLVAPAFSLRAPSYGLWVALLSPLVMVGLGGVWVSLFIRQLFSRSLLPYAERAVEASPAGPEAVS